MKGIGPKIGSPEYNQQIDDIATRGARAIKKTDEAHTDAVMDRLPGTASEIGKSFHNRLLRRSPADLAKLIGDTHLNTTTETSGRVSDLRMAINDQHFGSLKEALADIATAAEITPRMFEQLVEKLELIAAYSQAGDLKLVPRPLRSVIEDLTDGDITKLFEATAEMLGRYAYAPLRKAVDAPDG